MNLSAVPPANRGGDARRKAEEAGSLEQGTEFRPARKPGESVRGLYGVEEHGIDGPLIEQAADRVRLVIHADRVVNLDRVNIVAGGAEPFLELRQADASAEIKDYGSGRFG